MKSTPRKTAARGLHQPIPELEKTLAMPEEKRSRGANIHKKPRKYYTLPNGIKVVQHTR